MERRGERTDDLHYRAGAESLGSMILQLEDLTLFYNALPDVAAIADMAASKLQTASSLPIPLHGASSELTRRPSLDTIHRRVEVNFAPRAAEFPIRRDCSAVEGVRIEVGQAVDISEQIRRLEANWNSRELALDVGDTVRHMTPRIKSLNPSAPEQAQICTLHLSSHSSFQCSIGILTFERKEKLACRYDEHLVLSAAAACCAA